MAYVGVKFGQVKTEEIRGALKATGSKDPDVLYAAKEQFASFHRPLKWFGIWGMVCGVLMTLMIILAPLGIPLFILGVFWFKRAKKNNEIIEAAYADYIGAAKGNSPNIGDYRVGVA